MVEQNIDIPQKRLNEGGAVSRSVDEVAPNLEMEVAECSDSGDTSEFGDGRQRLSDPIATRIEPYAEDRAL